MITRMLATAVWFGFACSPAPRLDLVIETNTLVGALPERLHLVALVPDASGDRVVAFGAARRAGEAYSIFRLGEGRLSDPEWEVSPRRLLDTDFIVRLAVADVDGDGQQELIVRAMAGVYVIDREDRVRLLADLTYFNEIGTTEFDLEEGVVHGAGPATFWVAGTVEEEGVAEGVSRVFLRSDLCGGGACVAELPRWGHVLHQDGPTLTLYGEAGGRRPSLARTRCALDPSMSHYTCDEPIVLRPPGSAVTRRLAAFAQCEDEVRVFLGQDVFGRTETFGWIVRGAGEAVDGSFAVPSVDRASPLPGARAGCEADSTSLDAIAADVAGLSWHAMRCEGERCAHARERIELPDGSLAMLVYSDVPGYAEKRDGQLVVHRWVETREP